MYVLIRAEIRKAVSVRSLWGLLAVGAVLAVLSVLSSARNAGSGGLPPIGTLAGARNLFAAPRQITTLLAVLLGVMSICGEVRHGTLVQTLLACPRRSKVITAKIVAAALTSVLLWIVCTAAGTATALAWLHAHHAPAPAGAIAGPLAGLLVSGAACAALGVGFGALVRNQAVAVAVALSWFLVLEGLLINLAPGVARWLPGGAAAAFADASLGTRGTLLSVPAGGALLLGYATVLAWAGAVGLARRDVP